MIRLFPRSTRGLVLLIAGLLSLATLILGLIVYRVSHEALERQLRHRVLVQTQGLLAARRGGGPSALVAAIGLREAEGRGEGMGYILVGARGERLAGALRASPPEPGRRRVRDVVATERAHRAIAPPSGHATAPPSRAVRDE